MRVRRTITAGVLAVLLPLLAAGDCDADWSSPGDTPTPAPQHGQPAPAAPAPEANQPGPQDDPGACNRRGKRDVELQAHWQSDKRYPPKVMWMLNGIATPATNLRSTQVRDHWEGEWSWLITAYCGDTLVVRMEQAEGQTFGLCAIVDLGNGPVKTGKSCRAEYKVP